MTEASICSNRILFLLKFQQKKKKLLYSIAYMDHIFFIRSSVSGHLGCFHVLAIADSAAIHIKVHVSFELWFS